MPKVKNRPVGWSAAIHEFATAQRAAGRSPLTIRLHRHYLRQLWDVSPSPWRVTTKQLERVIATEHWGPESRKSARTVFRGFYRWAHGHGYLEDDPAFSLPSVKVPEGVARPAPEFVVRHAVTRLEDPRLTLMMQLAAFCGLRVREIAVVHSRDVIGDELLVHGKGGKQRIVPVIEPALLRTLQQLDGYAFPNRWTGEPITAGHVTRLMSAALPQGWTAHNLRHRLASRSYDGTGDLFAVMKLLGHSRPETTLRYIGLADRRVRAAAHAGLLAS
jgi:integrase